MTGLLAVGIHGLSELLPNWSNSSDAPLCPVASPSPAFSWGGGAVRYLPGASEQLLIG